MKRLLTFFLTFCCLLTTAWADEFTGKVVTQTKATELKADTWYALYNEDGKKFLDETGATTFKVNDTPALWFANESKGRLVKFVATGSDYYLLTASGKYVGEASTSNVKTSATATTAYTVAQTSAGFTIKNGSNYLKATSTSILGSTSASNWTLYEVTLKDVSALNAKQRTSFQMKQLGKDGGVLVRLNCKRNTGSYLTATTDNTASGASLKSKTDLSHIWYVTKSGDGYTLMSALTGSYMTSGFSRLSSETTLYIQNSPNNGDTGYAINISNKSDFSGKSCLNLDNNGVQLNEWSYSGDDGCDWYVDFVHEVTIEDVFNQLAEKDPYAKTLEEGKYYRIYNVKNDIYLTDAGTYINCRTLSEDLIQQYWTVKKNGNGYMFQNALTEKYIQPEYNHYTTYSMGANEATLYISRTSDQLKSTWNITNSQGASKGLHCDGSKNVVLWDNTNENNIWAFIPTELSQSDVDAARAEKERINEILNNLDNIKAALNTIYSDPNCTTLNTTYAAMSDEQLQGDASFKALPKELQEMTLKIKNNTWRKYDKFYRINEAEPMSNTQYWANQLRTTQYSPMNNPTGITANNGDAVFVWIGKIPSGITMKLCTHTDYTTFFGNEQMELKEGLNVFTTINDMSQIYIDYTVDNGQLLEKFPFVPYHIEGGTVNGFMDTRKQTNADWVTMQKQGYFQDEIIDIISERTHWRSLASEQKKVLSRPVEAMASWDKALRIQHELMGITAAPEGVDDPNGVFEDLWGKKFNNRMLSICWNGGGNPNSGGYRVYMSGFGNAMSDGVITTPDVWVIGHEVGHHNQGAFNMAGCTEVSNNVFSNAVAYNFNLSARTESMSARQELAALGRDSLSWATKTVYRIFHATDLYFKLYMYYHVLEHDPLFFPKMFKSLRNSPLSRGITTAENEYLKFALVACEAANEDLTEFFDYWGFFHNYGETTVTDYSSTKITIDAGQIRRVKAKMAKYPKANSALIFLDDFEDYNSGKKGAVDSWRSDLKKDYEYGDYHHFMDEGPTLTHDNYASYSTAGKVTISTYIEGVAGIKVYNANDELMYFSNKRIFTIPSKIRDDVSRFAIVLYDGTEMPLYMSSQVKDSEVWALKIYTPEFPEGLTRYTNGNDNANMSEERDGVNAIGVITSNYADGSEALLAQKNIVSKAGVAKNFIIDGNQPMIVPIDFTAENLAFSKDNEGFQAMTLPFDVEATTLVDNELTKNGVVAAGQPVVVNGRASFRLQNAAVKAGNFQTKENGFVLSADGKRIVAATEVAPFTYNFEGEAEVTVATAINDILSQPNAGEQKVYDMNGRRITKVKQSGLYIVNGKKMMVK